MTKKIYALLVGINDYKNTKELPTLQGCVNDIEVMETYLRKQINTDKQWELVEKILINESATRQNIIDGFQKHLCQADSEDVVLFYYAGHGSYEPAPDIFREKNQDRQLENINCYDSRTDGIPDLADKELNYLIEQVAQKNPHILVILDSCHSGTATRNSNVAERQAFTDGVGRDLKDFIFPETWVNKRLSVNYNLPKRIEIAACRPHQTAKEYIGSDKRRRGAFSYFLTEALQRASSLSYVDLVREINALITGKVDNQSPQIEGEAEDCRLTFLEGALGERINHFNLYYDEVTHHSWMIDGGILHVIRPVSEGDTILAIFSKDLKLEELLCTSNAICRIKVSEVLTESSKIELLDYNSSLPDKTAYWAVIVEVPLPPLKVYLTGDDQGVKLARTKLDTSIFLHKVELQEEANYYLEATKGQFWIKLATDKRPLAPIPETPSISGYTQQDANKIVQRLENIARWQNILDLKTPKTSQIQPEDIEMEIIITSGSNKYSSKDTIHDMRGEYSLRSDGKQVAPKIEVIVTNRSGKTIYFHIIDLGENYGIYVPNFFGETSSVRLEPEQSIRSQKPINFGIPPEYDNSGVTEYDDIFKLIASTREFDAKLLEQKGLNSPPRSQNPSSGISGTLNRLMNKVYTRDPLPDDDEFIDNWMTKEVKITYIKPPSGVEIKQSEPTTIIRGAELQGHSTFKGRFSLKALPPVSRNVDSNMLPSILLEAEDRNFASCFQFNATTRDASGILSVLEITEVKNYEDVTPENPLKIVVQNRESLLNSDQHLLITARDGNWHLPIGKGKTVDNRTEITIEHLPAPAINSRSLHGSIIILFHKLIYKTLGKEEKFQYPLLRSVEFSADRNRATYEKDKETIKLKVASSEKILLYIHGIIGDTASLVPSLQLAKFTENGQEKTLRDKYNLVLAFDYENIHTTIEDNAKLLKQRLEEVGLGANHGKQLHIVAHSMGGLVSRTFIEKEGGNQVVQHLVMLGTPNAGSPWSSLQDWAFMCLGIGLNQLSTVFWPANIIAALLAFLEVNDHALEQMNSTHSFIVNIGANPDPNVLYTIIAGDCSIKEEARLVEAGGQFKIMRLFPQNLLKSTADNVLNRIGNLVCKEPNDIAVTLQSIKSVDINRNPKPRVISPDAACDHLTYFSSQAGLDALIEALL